MLLGPWLTTVWGWDPSWWQCYVERDRGPSNFLNPVFRMYSEKEQSEAPGVFLLSARVSESECCLGDGVIKEGAELSWGPPITLLSRK